MFCSEESGTNSFEILVHIDQSELIYTQSVRNFEYNTLLLKAPIKFEIHLKK